MLKRQKDLLRPLVSSLRAILAGSTDSAGAWQRGDLDRELERLGVAEDGRLAPYDVVRDPASMPARLAAEAFIEAAVNGSKGSEAEQKRKLARAEVVERAAYTWINRLLALRAMETRGLIDETLRANPEYDRLSEALYALRHEAPARTSGADGGWWAVIDDACLAQAAALPGLFDPRDPAAALRPSVAALLRCVALVGGAPQGYTIEEADAAFADPDAIGWCYQFYQEAAKARVYVKLGSGGKAATRSEIAAATQLFTEPYMVQWLLQNSLGRSYHEAYPDAQLPATWAYFIGNRPEGQEPPAHPRPLESLDLIDPCCGSGHFLREAFDMFAAMYRERYPDMSATAIADRILERHLHGIDLDPRAAQLAALTLYLRAWEFVRAESKKRIGQRLSTIVYRPPTLNIASTPTGLSTGALQRHLRRHPGDRVLKPLLEGVFAALEQADILGSLLRPAEHVDAAIKALQQPHTIQMDFDADDATLRRTVTALANSDPSELKKQLLDRVAHSFAAEAGDDDVAARLFGREAEGGVRLLQLLDRTYAVVVTNPPYMGSKNMETPLKKYVEQHYKAGKRDLYAAFIMRCLELCRLNGRVAMVTQQSWMFMKSYVELRGQYQETVLSKNEKHFTGLLKSTGIECLVHLGSHAFEEISGEVVNTVLFTFVNRYATANHHLLTVRLVSINSHTEKALALLDASKDIGISEFKQNDFLNIPESPLVYWISQRFAALLRSAATVRSIAEVRKGFMTGRNDQFVVFFWEAPGGSGWLPYHKGGGYSKWSGFLSSVSRWDHGGARIKNYPTSVVASPEFYFTDGLTFSEVGMSSFGLRRLYKDELYGHMGPIVRPISREWATFLLGGVLNSRVFTYFLRFLTPNFHFTENYVRRLPVPPVHSVLNLYSTSKFCFQIKETLCKYELIFYWYAGEGSCKTKSILIAMLLTAEKFLEDGVNRAFGLQIEDELTMYNEVGYPAGFHPLITGYDTLPDLPADLDLPPLPPEVLDYLAVHERIVPSAAELQRIKQRLRGLYEAGPGVKESEQVTEAAEGGEGDEDVAVSGAHIPIPTETFLEELSVKLKLHPIAVYWLLEQLRAEGTRCKPEEQRLLEDRLSVLILRLLGHRWPKQIEAGEPLPPWADEDGIIPLTAGVGQSTLAERLRLRLRAEDGATGAQQAEALLAELTGLSLEEWLRREFFKRHMRQFKYRPIAWHLASDPTTATGGKGRGKGGSGGARSARRTQPAFECLVYYHACSSDLLARIRTQYVEPFLRAERQRLDAARRSNQETEGAQAQARIQELEEFNRRLQSVAEQGFATPELEKSLADEPLDRWSSDGLIALPDHADLLRQEQSWRVDLNDGVRVNIAPIQQAGLLVADVLKAADAKKALADRARWRSDERRWVRQGKLPRCGWMPDDIPESPQWTVLAPQREAEQAKLAEKRRAVVERGGQGVARADATSQEG
ncbi:BREX-1 system adenine-specific DNA-methyltransferase PglX [Candidatus Chloroploca asiatica]|uniref:site-specific DNA-methyltransferase (adenine-specific) n=1 Tax=Candidatus Chloroploca asiatica TaxID=1506545 RepID=A0A2H3LA22_9CHLR|nr:BREX-1 system adenine-specific DNA-methyltransferase PglX [Candidatus Chloroploca asiatica]PDW00255.1 hypothetical protein A9Q02_10575 [Candidatus Chloroploca asiatica]